MTEAETGEYTGTRQPPQPVQRIWRGFLIFDLDGTLFQTESVSFPAMERTFARLRAQGLTSLPTPSHAEQTDCYGLTMEQIWQRLLPGHPREILLLADRYLAQEEVRLLREGRGRLYPEVAETVAQLSQGGYALAVASNGGDAYVQAVIDTCGLRPYFQLVASAGALGTHDKADLVAKAARVLEQATALSSPVCAFMVGDRASDVAAGRKNGLATVGCLYGYGRPGELADCDHTIRRFSELLTLAFPRISPPLGGSRRKGSGGP